MTTRRARRQQSVEVIGDGLAPLLLALDLAYRGWSVIWMPSSLDPPPDGPIVIAPRLSASAIASLQRLPGADRMIQRAGRIFARRLDTFGFWLSARIHRPVSHLPITRMAWTVQHPAPRSPIPRAAAVVASEPLWQAALHALDYRSVRLQITGLTQRHPQGLAGQRLLTPLVHVLPIRWHALDAAPQASSAAPLGEFDVLRLTEAARAPWMWDIPWRQRRYVGPANPPGTLRGSVPLATDAWRVDAFSGRCVVALPDMSALPLLMPIAPHVSAWVSRWLRSDLP